LKDLCMVFMMSERSSLHPSPISMAANELHVV